MVDWTGLSNHTMTPVYHTKIKNCYTKGTRTKTANSLEVRRADRSTTTKASTSSAASDPTACHRIS